LPSNSQIPAQECLCSDPRRCTLSFQPCNYFMNAEEFGQTTTDLQPGVELLAPRAGFEL